MTAPPHEHIINNTKTDAIAKGRPGPSLNAILVLEKLRRTTFVAPGAGRVFVWLQHGVYYLLELTSR